MALSCIIRIFSSTESHFNRPNHNGQGKDPLLITWLIPWNILYYRTQKGGKVPGNIQKLKNINSKQQQVLRVKKV